MGKTIGVLSLKGGVGKTSIVSSLGVAIASFGKKVLLVDANFSAPNLGLHHDIIEPKNSFNHVMSGDISVKDAIHELDYFDILPSSVFIHKQISPLKLKDKLSPLKRIYDYIIIDSSPSLNEETLAAMLASDELLIATTPDHPTMSMTLKAIKLANQRGTKIDGLILNKVHGKKFELNIRDIENSVNVPVLAVIPYDLNVLKALSEFKSSNTHKPNSAGSIEFKKLAATLIGEKYKPKGIKNLFFDKITPRRQDINRTIFYNNVFN